MRELDERGGAIRDGWGRCGGFLARRLRPRAASPPRSRPPVRDPAVTLAPQIWIVENSRDPNFGRGGVLLKVCVGGVRAQNK